MTISTCFFFGKSVRIHEKTKENENEKSDKQTLNEDSTNLFQLRDHKMKIQQGKQQKTKTKHCCKKNKINNEKNKKWPKW